VPIGQRLERIAAGLRAELIFLTGEGIVGYRYLSMTAIASTSISSGRASVISSGRASVVTHHGICRVWSVNKPRPGYVDGGQLLVPGTGSVDRDLRDLPWPAPRRQARPRSVNPGPGLAAKPVLLPGLAVLGFLALAVLGSLADLQADVPAPSWLVRVGTCLALHFPGNNLRLCFDRPGLLIWGLGRFFAILPGPAAKRIHSAAKETHSVIIGRRLADFSHLAPTVHADRSLAWDFRWAT
jgi:hypothetical protein